MIILSRKLSLLVIFLLTQISCIGVSESPRYDISQISVGQYNIYFKREIRGRNYEGLSISTNSNLCESPSPKTDYFVNSETIAKVFYKVKSDELQIYSQNVFTPPQTESFPVKIVQRDIPRVEYSEENAVKLGYKELLLPDTSLKYCEK